MSEENTNVSLTIEPDLLQEIDKRAKSLDLNRSQYFRRLARNDLASEETAPRSARQLGQKKAA